MPNIEELLLKIFSNMIDLFLDSVVFTGLGVIKLYIGFVFLPFYLVGYLIDHTGGRQADVWKKAFPENNVDMGNTA